MPKLDDLIHEMSSTKSTPAVNDWLLLGNQYYSATDGKTCDFEKAKLCYEKAISIDPNHSIANYDLGVLHQYGTGVPKNLAKAKTYYEKAAATGYSDAKLRLLKMEMAETKPTPTANDWTILGNRYHNVTDGKADDFEKAKLCYEKAISIDTNHSIANYDLGVLHQYGLGVHKNLIRAKDLYNIAKANGYTDVTLRLLEIEIEEKNSASTTIDKWLLLGNYYYSATDGKTCDFEKAKLCYEKAISIDPNHSIANYDLGVLHQYGTGVPKNLAKAKTYYEKAAATGYSDAKLRLLKMEMAETKPTPTANDWTILGNRYHNVTDGKADDFEKAKLCYEKAISIDTNHSIANYDLGVLHQYGLGVHKNLIRAKDLYNIAKANGYTDVTLRLLEIEIEEKNSASTTIDKWLLLGNYYYSATDGKTCDFEKAKLCYEKAISIDPNHSIANYDLGVLHQYGTGVPKNLAKAKTYYEKAAATGYSDAKLRLLKMEMAETKPTPTANDWTILGNQYYSATDGKTCDFEKAKLCYEKAISIDPNHSIANYDLGVLHQYGLGVHKNLIRAKDLYNIAKANGYTDVTLRLLEIEIEEKNSASTTIDKWLLLGNYYYSATDGKTCDFEKAKLCYEKAISIDPNHSIANYDLGVLHQYGTGVPKNLAKAKTYYEKAAATGYSDAKLRLLKMEMAETKPTPTANDWTILGNRYHN